MRISLVNRVPVSVIVDVASSCTSMVVREASGFYDFSLYSDQPLRPVT